MKASPITPTKPGYYWAKYKDGGEDLVIVHLSGMVDVMGTDELCTPGEFIFYEGPLKPSKVSACDMCGEGIQDKSYAVSIGTYAFYDFLVCKTCMRKLGPSLKFLYDKQIVDEYLIRPTDREGKVE